MMKRAILAFCITAVVVLAFAFDADAQCAMCKATTESSLQETGENGNGINKGILYIMFIPYTLILIMVGVFFRKNLVAFAQNLGLIKQVQG
ncbi:MAG TPA: hypothetical protein VFV37_02270 [Luteibaculaceae bacterium]|nr:hypothetical protein [Luteibaculaceae bacterium]